MPDLVIDILSHSTRKYVKSTKFKLYERIGVKEYWIVEYKLKTIDQYVLNDGKYELYEVVAIMSEFELDNLPKNKKDSYTTIIKPTIFHAG